MQVSSLQSRSVPGTPSKPVCVPTSRLEDIYDGNCGQIQEDRAMRRAHLEMAAGFGATAGGVVGMLASSMASVTTLARLGLGGAGMALSLSGALLASFGIVTHQDAYHRWVEQSDKFMHAIYGVYPNLDGPGLAAMPRPGESKPDYLARMSNAEGANPTAG